MQHFPECGKPLDLDRGADLSIDEDQVPDDLRHLIPYVNRWSFSSLHDQDVFVAQMKRHRQTELKKFNKVFTTAVSRRIGEWSSTLPFDKHVSTYTDEDWSHPYWAFQNVLKLREISGDHEQDPAVDAMLERHRADLRAEKYATATIAADEAFRSGDYSGYIRILDEFNELLTPTQMKKIELARRKTEG